MIPLNPDAEKAREVNTTTSHNLSVKQGGTGFTTLSPLTASGLMLQYRSHTSNRSPRGATLLGQVDEGQSRCNTMCLNPDAFTLVPSWEQNESSLQREASPRE